MEPSKSDIFFCGVVAGMFLLIAAQFIENFLKHWLRKKDMELNATLGRAILEMQNKMNEGQNEETKN